MCEYLRQARRTTLGESGVAKLAECNLEGTEAQCTVLYGKKKIQPDNSRKFQENSKNGRAPRAKRAAHARFWDFSGFFGIFLNFFPYNTVAMRECNRASGRELTADGAGYAIAPGAFFSTDASCLLFKSDVVLLTLPFVCRASGTGASFSFDFQKIGQNGCPGGREAPQSISFDESSRIKSVWARWIFGTFFYKTKSARTETA